jgi:hypothetical protein
MLRCWIDVRLLQDLRLEGARALHCGVEVVHLEPQENAVSDGRGIGVDEVRVLLFIPRVELEDERAVAEEALVDVGVLVYAKVPDAEEP